MIIHIISLGGAPSPPQWDTLNMTLHLGIINREHHDWKKTDGSGPVSHWIFDNPEGKIPEPASNERLDPESKESYYQKTRKVLWQIYAEEPELLEDGTVILYQCGVKGANNGCRDAIEAEGFAHACAIFDESTNQYNLQPKGILDRNETTLWREIEDALPVVPLAALRCTTSFRLE